MVDSDKMSTDNGEASAFNWPEWRQLDAELSAFEKVIDQVSFKVSEFRTFAPIHNILDTDFQRYLSELSVLMEDCEDNAQAVIQCVEDIRQERTGLFDLLEKFESVCDVLLADLEEKLELVLYNDLYTYLTSLAQKVLRACRRFYAVLCGALIADSSMQTDYFKSQMPEGNASLQEVLLEVCQKVGGLNEKDARDVAFHLLDWHGDLCQLNQLFEQPQRFNYCETHQILVNFLVHAPNHIAAAAKLYIDYPVSDVFQIDAVKA